MNRTGMLFFVTLAAVSAAQVNGADYSLSSVPIGTTEVAEPNVMILMDNSGSMKDRPAGQSGGKKKIDQAKTAARTVIESGSGMRLGLASFNTEQGGKIDRVCGSSQADLLSTLDGYRAENWTPMSEAYYEVTRYFRGMKGHFAHKSSAYASPITSQCQKNFTIVITDGEPTKDGDFNNLKDPDAGNNLPNWDKNDQDNGNNYLDDLAKFAWDTDMSGEIGVQNMHTYTIGFDINLPMLKDAASNGHGQYFQAGNESELLASLTSIFADISKKTFTETRLSANSGYVNTGLKLYQASYNTVGWTGELSGYNAVIDPTSGDLSFAATPSWEASSSIPTQNSRIVITNRGSLGIPFRSANLNAAEKLLLSSSSVNNYIEFIRGEEKVGLRSRSKRLGDIVHSNPIYVGASAGFGGSKSYRTFKNKTQLRKPVIYVGANDGMLHGFSAADGKELLAYIPSVLLPKLKLLAVGEYAHQYYVDGTPMVNDAIVGGKWRTMLAGGLNGGGQGVYVLDVTDPDDFTEANADKVFAWEFTDRDDADMGYSYAQPAIVKLQDGKWYVVFGNGYNSTAADGHASTTGDAVIYIVDLETGQNVIKLSTETGLDEAPVGLKRPNGMSTLAPVSDDGETVNVIYGGDLYGNVWKFDLRDPDSTKWKLDYKLFQACRSSTMNKPCSADDIQPITASIAVSEDKQKHNMLFFGTGKDFELSDKTDSRLQTLYGVIDTGSQITAGRSALLEQSIYYQGSANFDGVTRDIRLTTNSQTSTSQKGWFMDLQVPGGNGGWVVSGERVLSEPRLTSQKVVFATKVYTSDPCAAGGEGYEIMLDKYSGSRLSYVTIDNNRDGVFDDKDKVTDDKGNKVAVSGEKVGNGAGTTTIVGDSYNFRVNADDLSDSGGNANPPDKGQKDPNVSGRTSWRYLERN
ncbi:PilC/PilY family type IV pilus protein [uncultured Amphritea sp.]|uniref:pilus assembly protein n=1 Tax=uncultured Amphritea sp. TaxID=981605 RepID=UPI00262E8B2F|nr:PilC/PilY family type IV pilus protein [uncultured Amphritea sp.]